VVREPGGKMALNLQPLPRHDLGTTQLQVNSPSVCCTLSPDAHGLLCLPPLLGCAQLVLQLGPLDGKPAQLLVHRRHHLQARRV